VTFTGEDHVQNKGTHNAQVTADDVAFLAKAFERADFEHLQKSYVSESDGCLRVWTDRPTVDIVLTRNGQKRHVAYYYGCEGFAVAHRIDWLAKTIDEVAGTAQWVEAVPSDVMTWLKNFVATQKTFEGKTAQYPLADTDSLTMVEGQLDGNAAAAVLFDVEDVAGPGMSVQYLALFWKRDDHYQFCCSHRVGGRGAGAVKTVTFLEHKLRLTGHLFVPGKDAECCPTKPYVVDVAVVGSTLVDAPRTSNYGAKSDGKP
jgi:hypothetical protein